METRSTKPKAGPSSAGDDTGIDIEHPSISQLREQLAEQAASQAAQLAEQAASQAAFQAQIMQLLGELRPGSHPATTDHGPEPNPAVPVATEDATSPTSNNPIQRFTTPPLEPLSPQASYHEFLDWRQQWNDMSLLSKLHLSSIPSQLACLRSALSPEMRTTLISIGVKSMSDLTPDQILDQLQTHLRAQRSVLADRFAFLDAHQQSHETIEEFLRRLVKLRQSAHLCLEHKTHEDCADFSHIAAIIRGIRDVDLRTKILAIQPSPTLQQVLTFIRSHEAARINEPSVARPQNPINIVSTQQQQPKTQTPDTCTNCGKSHRPDQTCPAKGKICNACDKPNHFANVCRSKTARKVLSVTDSFIGAIETTLPTSRAVPSIQVEISDGNLTSTITATPDSGASTTVINLDTLRSLEIDEDNLCLTSSRLTSANQEPINSIGALPLTVRFHNRVATTIAVVCPKIETPLLSWTTCIDLGILPDHYPSPLATINSVTHSLSDDDIPSLKSKLLAEFSDVFDDSGPLKPMTGPPMSIELASVYKPFALSNARPIPIAWRDPVKKILEDMVTQCIIAPVTEPTEWTHPLVVVAKRDGTPRICVDLTNLNRFVKRPLHPTQTPKQAVSRVSPSAKYLCTYDAKHGYWQIPLAEESQHLTTFITPWGRYKFLRGPMGLMFTGDEYCRRTDAALGHLPRLYRVMDDMLAESHDLTTCYSDARNLLLACRANNITLGKKKFDFAVTEAKFAGYIVGPSGVSSDPAKVEAIAKFPKPTNITEMRSFFGLVNQLADFCPHIASAAVPMRDLLRTGQPFTWNSDHDTAFEATKAALVSPPVLAHFDLSADTVLMTDASRKNGLGYALLQSQANIWRLIQCGSRFTTDAESRYSATELELCAVKWAIKKCRLYLLGLSSPFKLVVDHQALVSILDKYTLDAVENPRLQRMKENLLPYRFSTVWKKGKSHHIPDALSRSPVSDPTPDDLEDEQCSTYQATTHLISQVAGLTNSADHSHLDDPTLKNLRAAALLDPEYTALLEAVLAGFPTNPNHLDLRVKPYWKVRNDLWTEDGLVLRGSRIVIPPSCRRDTLQKLHASHQGIERTKRRARQLVFWPGINNDILTSVSACDACQKYLPSLPPEPLLSDPPPAFAFQDTSMDIFAHNGHHYLVYVDRLSGWPVIANFPNRNLKSRDVISVLRHCFMTYGVPSRIRSDGGLQFASSEFADFATTWSFTHVMSSPHHPKSNGHAEAAVKAMKRLLQKASPSGVLDSDAFASGLLEWRNTPNSDGLSPAQILFGRQLRSQIPSHTTNFTTNPSNNSRDRASSQRKSNKAAKLRHDVHARTLPLIPVGTRVRVQHPLTKLWDATGTIISSNNKRDYRIMMSSGRIYWRNRKYVRPTTSGHYQTHQCASNPEQPPESSKRTPTSTTSSRRRTTRTLEPPRRSARLARHTSLRPTIPSTSSAT